jgi:polar amino acid transport system permease protein
LVLDTLIESLPQLFEGLKITVGLTIFSLILGSIFGILMAIGRVYGRKPLAILINIYEKTLRGIPLLVIFFIIYFGLSEIGLNLNAFNSAVLGLGLRSTAYQAQIYRSAINSIPAGQMVAARSIGMSKIKAIRYIILPQALRLSIPGWSNELTIVLKDTSIAFGIGVVDLMRRGRYIYSVNHELVLQILLIIALIYFVLVFSINKGLNYLEKKYKITGLELEIER